METHELNLYDSGWVGAHMSTHVFRYILSGGGLYTHIYMGTFLMNYI